MGDRKQTPATRRRWIDPNAASRPLTVRMPKGVIRALEIIGVKQTRTRSLQILHYVLQGLAADGLMDVADE